MLLGGLLGGASDDQLQALRRYADALGLAFQIVDDLLAVEEASATLGKTAGKDVAQGKLTYPALLGVDTARAEVELPRSTCTSARLARTSTPPADGMPAPRTRW